MCRVVFFQRKTHLFRGGFGVESRTVSGIWSAGVLGLLVLVLLHLRLVVGMVESVERDLQSRLLEFDRLKIEDVHVE